MSNFIIPDIVNAQMAHCFDMRERSSSFDLHDIRKTDTVDSPDGQDGHHKPSFLAKLIRSISENSMRKKSPSASPASSPKNSPKPGSQRRRRFVRVIKNDEQIGEEYVNPHVVRKYEKGFWESKYMKKSASLDEPQRPLPYTVTGPTILKKAHSMDSSEHPESPSGTPPMSAKSCKFNESVEIIEYDIKGKCLMIMNEAHVSHEKLHEPSLYCLDTELFHAPRSDQCPLKVSIEPKDINETNYKLEALEVIDENKALKDDEEQLLDDVHQDELKDDVFERDSSETDSATESCNECRLQTSDGDKKGSHLNGLGAADCSEVSPSPSSWDESRCSNSPPPPAVRQNSDEGISAPKKCRIIQESASAASGAVEDSPASMVTVEQ